MKEQELPDPEFSTVKSPNPEEHAAFELAIRDGKKVGADLLIATDPDADRLGIAVRNQEGEYVVLTGNQTGALLLITYLLKNKERNICKWSCVQNNCDIRDWQKNCSSLQFSYL